MAKKFGFWDDVGEQLVELGKSTVKASAKAAGSIVSPSKLIDAALGNAPSSKDKSIEQLEKGKGKKQNNTPLDLQKLQEKYKDQDTQKTSALRQRLFQIVKSSEEKTIMQNKQKEMEKKRSIAYEEQEKKRRIEQQRNQQGSGLPQGKVRRSIFSKKKTAQREQTEVKPASGKQ